MASGISLGSFSSRPDSMQQRSYSVSSADQWNEATVIANSAISSGKRGRGPLAVLGREPGAGRGALTARAREQCVRPVPSVERGVLDRG